MSKTGKVRDDSRTVTKYAVILAFGWMLLAAATMLLIVREEMKDARELVRNEARTHFLKDQAFRFWGASHGGVYVPPTDHTPPNPYLSHIPDRDIVSTEGKKLTLMNPAYMVRQTMEDYAEQYGGRSHLTSLKPLRPQNAPDEWERAALESFDRGNTEVNEFTEIDGKPYLRLMRPVMVKTTCLKCHGHQGYKEGDVRGGFGVSIPAEAYYTAADEELVEHALTVGLLWLVGFVALVFGARHIQQKVRERNQAEEALLESLGQYRSLVEIAGVGILVDDTAGNFTYFNKTFAAMFGYTMEEMGRLTFNSLVHPDFLEQGREEYYNRFHQKASTSQYEFKGQKKDGVVLFLEVDADALTEEKEVTGWRSYVRDITDRKCAEEERKKIQHEMGERVKELRCMYSIAESIQTRTTLEEVFQDVADLIPPGWHYPEITRGKVIFDGKEYTSEPFEETRWKQSSDIIVDGESRGSIEVYYLDKCQELDEGPFLTEERNLINGVAKSISKAVERKQAEGRLLESEEKYRSITERTFDVIMAASLDGEISYVSPSVRRVFGTRPEQLVGRNIIEFVPKAEISHAMETLQRCAAGKTVKGHHSELVRRDGSYASIELNAVPIYKADRVIGAQAVIRDITETKRLQALESRAERLELAGTIAGQVAHDFNNLLSPIVAYPEFIHVELPHDNKAHAYLDAIENAAKKIADINQDLLTMGRRGYYCQRTLNLNRIVLNAVKEMESRTNTVTYEMDLCDELMNIEGGDAQIHRMLDNLLVNAQDAIQDIGQITIRTENYYADYTSTVYGRVPKGEYVKLTISDNGSGIPDDIIQTILDPFFSTKVADMNRGSGLGLSVVDAVMKDHDGYLDLISKVGQGTSFFLYFPVSRKDVGGDKPEHLATGTETILVVDDDEMQRTVSTHLLMKLGYQVSAVESGENAIEFLKENPQNLVILDMVMPGGIDGAETYQQILTFSPNQKAIIVSGFSETSRVQEAQALGAGAFVKKPITKKAIAVAVREELDRQVEVMV